MSLEPDEHALIERAKGGNREALETLLTWHFDALYRHIARRIPSGQRAFSAEDITQEALLEAFAKIDRLRETSLKAFVVWLKAIGELTLLRRLRDEGRQKRGGQMHRRRFAGGTESQSVISLLDILPAATKTASSVLARRETIGALQVAVAGLPDDQRRAVELHLLKGRSLEETAQALDRTPAAIRGLVYRGKQQLAETMGRASQWFRPQ
jgi:RNA polymerase sigma-70 factor (ECF subfamily)